MSDSGKKLYEERVASSAKTKGAYQPWDRLTEMAQSIWNQRAKTNAASKKAATGKGKKSKKSKTKKPAKEG